MTDNSGQRETVTVLGERLPVRTTDGDHDDTRQAAKRLREQIESLQEQAPEATRLQIALLTGLNFAGRLTQMENEPEFTGLSPELLKKMKTLEKNMQAMTETD